MFDWTNKRILLTGGTGSFGQAFIKFALKELPVKTICVFSRDELKQSELAAQYPNDKRLRFFVGDVRDCERINSAMRGVDVVIHAAAMKRIEACEYNPMEAVKTNILGTQNVIAAAVEAKVDRVIALSTDKAVKPVTHYGATKMCMEQLVVLANNKTETKLSCVRYGNVAGSRGSIIPILKKQRKNKEPYTITNPGMTRFWITLPEAINFVLDSIQKQIGGEIFTPEIPSFRLMDLVEAVHPEGNCKIIVTGIRGMEKFHEEMKVNDDGSVYDSGSNPHFLSVSELKEKLNEIS